MGNRVAMGIFLGKMLEFGLVNHAIIYRYVVIHKSIRTHG